MVDFNDLISHPSNRKLKAHLEQVTNIIKNRLKNYNPVVFDSDYVSSIEIAAKLHDIGKATSYFQQYIKTRDIKEQLRLKNKPETHHAKMSAVIAFAEARKRKLSLKSSIFVYLAIRYHHSNLSTPIDAFTLDEFDYETLASQIRSIDCWRQIVKELDLCLNVEDIANEPVALKHDIRKIRLQIKRNYFMQDDYFKFLYQYSLLIAADKIAAGVGYEAPRIVFDSDLITKYRLANGWDKPEKSSKPVNKIRNYIYNETIKKAVSQPSAYILNAPTGAGKTVTALALALEIRKKQKNMKRIIYALPFTSIIDQNYKIYSEIFEKAGYKMPINNLLLKHHHLVDVNYKFHDNEEEINANDGSQLLIEDWSSEIIVTTFIQFFYSLVGDKNKMLKKFNRFPGSVLIIDELQAIPIKYWRLLSILFNKLIEQYNCSIIIATATKPPIILNQAIELCAGLTGLYKTMGNRFKLEEAFQINTISELANKVIADYKHGSSILIIVNTISASKQLFSNLRNKSINLIYLSSSITPFERLTRIRNINTTTHKVVISTQIVEAGVDIDLDIVYRDMAPLDSILQSAGRCNRNMEKSMGVVKIIDLIDEKTKRKYASYIYDDVLLNQTRSMILDNKIVKESDLNELVEIYFSKLVNKKRQDKEIIESLDELRFDKLADFKLIENKLDSVSCFIELNEKASLLWERYQGMRCENNIFKRKSLFNKFKGEFLQYVLSLNLRSIKRKLPSNNGIIYIDKTMLDYYYDKSTGFKLERDDGVLIY